MRLTRLGITALSVSALVLTGCSSGSSSGGGGGGGDAGKNVAGRGPITYVQGKDNSNVIRPMIEQWNSKHPTEKVTFKEQSDKADQQHDDLVQHFQAKDKNYDVVSVDVIWTAEFAAKGWLQPLKDKLTLDTSGLLPSTVKTATYNNTLYAAPVTSDGGMLYYRKDLVPTPPATWDEMVAMCPIAKKNAMDCYAGQFAKYEGLTVNAAEAINTFGGQIVKDDGKTANVDTPEANTGLSKLADAYKSGVIPKQAITYQEEAGRISFENGKLLFLRNWPYVYSLATTDASSKIKGKFAVAPLPGKDGPGASSLGGHNDAISVYSQHKATALDFIKYVESSDIQKNVYVLKASNAPALAALYDDPELNAKLPYLSTLKKSLGAAVPRPVTPFYPAVTKAVEDNAYAAINGSKTVAQALKDMQAAINAAAG